MRWPAGMLAAMSIAACVDTPDYEGRLCARSEPCPAGYYCGLDGTCHVNGTAPDAEPAMDAAPDAGVDAAAPDAGAPDAVVDAGTRDADAPDAPARDADAPDAAAPDADPPDTGPPDTGPPPDSGPLEVVATVASVLDDAMEGPPTGDTLVEYAWASLYSADHWAAVRVRLPGVDRNAVIVGATLELYLDSAEEDSPDVDIHLQEALLPAQFGIGPNDIALRARSAIFQRWTATDLGEGWAVTPPVTALVQRAVDRAGWVPNTPIVLIFDERASANLFEFRQYDHPPAGMFAPRLRVLYHP